MSFLKGALLGIAATATLLTASPALSASWPETIKRVEKRAQTLWDYATENGAGLSPGSAYNEYGAVEHTCTITGRLLGFESEIKHLENVPEPELKPANFHEIQIHSVWLSNWAHLAKRFVAMSEDERRQVWNINCAGKQGIPAALAIMPEETQANFRQEGPSTTYVLGNVDKGFFEEFKAWLDAHPDTDLIWLGSGGGSVGEAVKAGRLIRERKINTQLADNCYSACVFVFFGGVNRTIMSPYPTLGFHQASIGGVALEKGHPVYEIVGDYAEEMGVDREFVLKSMHAAPPSDLHEADGTDLCRANAATWIQRWCSASEFK